MLVGWLHEEAGQKLVVDCTGQSVVFVEDDAVIAVVELSNAWCPPFPCFEEFIGDDHVYRASPPGVLLAVVAEPAPGVRPGDTSQMQRLHHGPASRLPAAAAMSPVGVVLDVCLAAHLGQKDTRRAAAARPFFWRRSTGSPTL